jgi:hypothetical protein
MDSHTNRHDDRIANSDSVQHGHSFPDGYTLCNINAFGDHDAVIHAIDNAHAYASPHGNA